MLTISKPLSSGQAHSYHEKEFASADQNYYSQASGVRGEWQGQLAKAWGLVGEVRASQFYRLAEGQDPESGEQLVRHRIPSEYQNGQGDPVSAASHRAGWDATFRAPKSVSITALVGGDERVREAHRESVRVALNELEHYVQARIGGNHPAETTGKMVAAKFEHDSARPVNGYAAPQLHTHAVIFNVTETGNGKTHALQPRELYRTQRYATAIYRSELTARLRKLGYTLEHGASGEFEIKGYTAEYLAASSPRRQQIKQYLKAIGLEGAEAAEIGAHRTREAKIHLNPQGMKRINLTLAAQHGNGPQAVVAQARHRQQSTPEAIGNSQEAAPRRNPVAQMALTYARDRNMEREATVEERVLLQDALKRAMGGATLGEIRENLEARLKSGEFVAVSSPAAARAERELTTAQMRSVERENIATMQSGQGLGKPLVRPKTQRSIESEFQHLSRAQRQAVGEVLESRDRFTGFEGIAGSGKTTTLAAVRRAAEAEGYQVQGFAPTSRAAQQLEAAGIRSATLQRFLTQPRPAENEGRRLYVLDESSLASTRLVNDLLKRLQGKDRVLLVGDTRQHQAVEAGRPFQQMREAGMHTVQLDEILRQKDPELKQTVELLAQSHVKEAIQQLERQGRIHEIPDAQERLEAIARDYLRQPEGTFVISPDNRSRIQINELVHESLKAQGSLSQQEYSVNVLVNCQDLTGTDRQWAAQYQPGDVLRYTRGSRRIGVEAGGYATVAAVDRSQNLLTGRRPDGRELTYDPRRLQGVNVYRSEERDFAEGDRIQFTAPFQNQRVANRELGRLERIDTRGNVEVRLDSGRAVHFNLAEHRHLDYGYAMTSYSSQGQTADRVLVHLATERDSPGLVNRRLAYVALSRTRPDAQVYTDNAPTLGERLGREVSKTTALEQPPGAPDQRQRPSGNQRHHDWEQRIA